jgi:hypothetical protein
MFLFLTFSTFHQSHPLPLIRNSSKCGDPFTYMTKARMTFIYNDHKNTPNYRLWHFLRPPFIDSQLIIYDCATIWLNE